MMRREGKPSSAEESHCSTNRALDQGRCRELVTPDESEDSDIAQRRDGSATGTGVPMRNHDGSVMLDHRGRVVYRSQFLSTHPIRSECKERVGYAGRKFTYVSGDGVIRNMNAAFGSGGWGSAITMERLVMNEKDSQGRWVIGYITTVRVTLENSVSHEDCGSGEGINNNKTQAHEKAMKSAVTDALKRACRHFGERLGNALYVKGNGVKTAPKNNRSALLQIEAKDALDLFGEQDKLREKFDKDKNGDDICDSERKSETRIIQTKNRSNRVSMDGDGIGGDRSNFESVQQCGARASRSGAITTSPCVQGEINRPRSGTEKLMVQDNLASKDEGFGREKRTSASFPQERALPNVTPKAAELGQKKNYRARQLNTNNPISPRGSSMDEQNHIQFSAEMSHQGHMQPPPPTPFYDPLGTLSRSSPSMESTQHQRCPLKRPAPFPSDQIRKRVTTSSNPYGRR
mmetsp:Transcript_3166/g.8255  ORF Transcript_3166/g.8255 Transcript_3166/m.8255 type:complete len:460 (-) Transcript_3166:87-1466(-)